MIYYILLFLGAYSAAMAAVWLYRVITDGRFNYYLSVLSASWQLLPGRMAARRRYGNGRVPLPWGW